MAKQPTFLRAVPVVKFGLEYWAVVDERGRVYSTYMSQYHAEAQVNRLIRKKV